MPEAEQAQNGNVGWPTIQVLGHTVKKWRCVVSLPGDNMYLREQTVVAKATADRFGVELQFTDAEMDPVLQSQQLLKFVQATAENRPHGILIEPVSATGLPRVAEAAVAAGIAWVVSNAQVDYLGALRTTAKAPVFLVSQDHVDVGRIQGRQMGAMLPGGGTVLYLRGPAMSSIATRRFEGLDSARPKNVELKSLKVQGSGADGAFAAVSSWLSLSTGKPEGTQLIFSQNADFILGARKAFEANAAETERKKWLALPCAGVGIPGQIRPLVDQGLLRAAVMTSLTMDTAIEMLAQSMTQKSQPREQTFVEAYSYPSLEDL
ncbi:MAG TPA: substrate-binding domain-containing protein, partial [Candidatus Acidoferrales bacterium]|nr:substrate-binding domain-containing protein [Candidatus Acidoferrales bacterium]